jgi:hypothetical protein
MQISVQRRNRADSRHSNHPEIDGIGSVAIGLLLAASILTIANAHPGCLQANGLLTVQLGPEHVVAMLSLEFADSMLAPQIEEAVISLEEKVREENPEIVALFVKPQTATTFQDQRDQAFDSPKKSGRGRRVDRIEA